MDKDIKDVLLNIELEIKEINNKLSELQKTQLNGNYVYTEKRSNNHKAMN